MKKVKDKAVDTGKETLSYYHYHKFDKRYDELIKQAREKSASGYRREKTWEKEKGKILALVERFDNYKASVCLLSITSWFRLITIRRNEI